MRVGIAIDVSTDVSSDFIRAHGIHVLPSTLHLGGRAVVYDRNVDQSLDFYRHQMAAHGLHSETTPFSVRAIEDLFLQKLVLDYDYVFLITLASTRSQTYENAHQASFTILQSYTGVRAAQRVPGPFALRVVDSQTLFTGPAVLTWEAVRLREERRTPVDIRKHLDDLLPHLHSYFIPNDLHHMRARAVKRGDQSVGWLATQVASALDIKPIIHAHRSRTEVVARPRHFPAATAQLFAHAEACIRRGLKVPMLALSYGGELSELEALSGYGALAATAREYGVELMTSMMAPAGAVNVGAGTLTLAYCSEQPAAL